MDSIFAEFREHEGVVNVQLTEGAAHVSVDLTPEEANELGDCIFEAIPRDALEEFLPEDDDG